MRTAAVLAGVLLLSGCVSSPANAPAWFNQAAAQADEDYPSLRDVPATTIANTNEQYWARVEADLLRARQDLKNNPRAEPAPAQGSDEFINQARQELERARQAHPN